MVVHGKHRQDLTQEEDKSACESETHLNKKGKLSDLNELTCLDLILAINTSSFVGKVAFGLV